MNEEAKKNLLDKIFSEEVRTPPDSCLDEISGGRMAGMTNIKPQWRIDTMNKLFGLYGTGWYYEEIASGEQKIGDVILIFVQIALYYKTESGEWSKPIISKAIAPLVSQESKGLYIDEECWKKAATDALGKAMSFLGIGATVYLGKNASGNKNKKEDTPVKKDAEYYQRKSIITDPVELKKLLEEMKASTIIRDILKASLIKTYENKIALLEKK